MITPDNFRLRFPEFCDKTDFPNVRIELFIGDTIFTIGSDENHWGAKYDIAQSYLTAHLLHQSTKTEYGDAGSSGPIVSKSAGGVSVARAAQDLSGKTSTEVELMSTSYGQRYITIRDTCFVGVLVANRA